MIITKQFSKIKEKIKNLKLKQGFLLLTGFYNKAANNVFLYYPCNLFAFSGISYLNLDNSKSNIKLKNKKYSKFKF